MNALSSAGYWLVSKIGEDVWKGIKKKIGLEESTSANDGRGIVQAGERTAGKAISAAQHTTIKTVEIASDALKDCTERVCDSVDNTVGAGSDLGHAVVKEGSHFGNRFMNSANHVMLCALGITAIALDKMYPGQADDSRFLTKTGSLAISAGLAGFLYENWQAYSKRPQQHLQPVRASALSQQKTLPAITMAADVAHSVNLSRKDVTPLMQAAFRGDSETIRKLQRQGVDLEATDEEGRTAMHYAALGKQQRAIDQLWYFGCSLTTVDHEDQTPIKLIERSHPLHEHVLRLRAALSRFDHEKPIYPFYPPEALVFKGGGAKGLAYVGVHRYLHEHGLLRSVKHVAGTSAGAINAMLLALDYSPEDMERILKGTELTDFLDHPFKSLEELSQKVLAMVTKQDDATIKDIVSACKAIYRWRYCSEQQASLWDTIKGINEKGGFCEGKAFLEWIEDKIAAKTGIPNCTFKEYRRLVETKGLKHIHIFATKMDSPSVVHFTSEDRSLLEDPNSEQAQLDDVVMSHAIRASMSIPVLFKPHIVHVKTAGNSEPQPCPELGSFLDGGLTKNLPIETFDYVKYSATNPASGKRWTNHQTLAFNLVDPPSFNGDKKEEAPAGTPLPGVIGAAIKTYYTAEDLHQQQDPNHRLRTVNISNCGVGLVDGFFAKESDKTSLLESGKTAIGTFFEEAEKLAQEQAKHDPRKLLSIYQPEPTARNFLAPKGSFIGREAQLQSLEERLISEAPGYRQCLLWGPSGMGKSELAAAFAIRTHKKFFRETKIDAQSSETLLKSYRELAGYLGISYQQTDSFETIRANVHAVLEALPPTKRHLLIYDNIDKMPILPHGDHLSILLISKHALPEIDDQELLRVESLTYEEAIDAVLKMLPFSSKEKAENLVRLVGMNPTILTEIAHLIRTSPGVTLDSFLGRLESNPKAILDRIPSARAFMEAMRKIEKSHPEAYDWMQVCSFGSPRGCTIQQIDAYLQSVSVLFDDGTTIQEHRDAILRTLITEHQFLLCDEKGQKLSLQGLHRIILQGTFANESSAKKQRILDFHWTHLWKLLQEYNPAAKDFDSDPSDKSPYVEWQTIDALYGFAYPETDWVEHCTFLLSEKNLYPGGKEAIREALMRKALGWAVYPQHPQITLAQMNKACSLVQSVLDQKNSISWLDPENGHYGLLRMFFKLQNDFCEAAIGLHKYQDVLDRVTPSLVFFGETDIIPTRPLLLKVKALNGLKRYKQAIECYEDLLQQYSEIQPGNTYEGPFTDLDYDQYTELMDCLGRAYQNEGNFQRAEACYCTALSVLEAMYSKYKPTPRLVAAAKTLASFYTSQRSYADALNCTLKILRNQYKMYDLYRSEKEFLGMMEPVLECSNKSLEMAAKKEQRALLFGDKQTPLTASALRDIASTMRQLASIYLEMSKTSSLEVPKQKYRANLFASTAEEMEQMAAKKDAGKTADFSQTTPSANSSEDKKESSADRVSFQEPSTSFANGTNEAPQDPFVPGQPGVGILNGGNTCFMNAAMQVVEHDPIRRAAIRGALQALTAQADRPHGDNRFEQALNSYLPLDDAYRAALKERASRSIPNRTLRSFRGFMPGDQRDGQQDADVFLGSLMAFTKPEAHPQLFHTSILRKQYAEIAEESLTLDQKRILAVKSAEFAKAQNNPTYEADQHFGTVRRNGFSIKQTTSWEIGLGLPSANAPALDGQNLFDAHFEEQDTRGDEPVICRKEDNTLAYFQPIRQQAIFPSEAEQHAQQRLDIRLNRFYFNQEIGVSRRNSIGVNMPDILDANGGSYEQRAVICHLGESIEGGHYTAVIKDEDGKWWLFNDSSVCELSREEKEEYVRSYGYTYHYRRIRGHQASSKKQNCLVM